MFFATQHLADLIRACCRFVQVWNVCFFFIFALPVRHIGRVSAYAGCGYKATALVPRQLRQLTSSVSVFAILSELIIDLISDYGA